MDTSSSISHTKKTSFIFSVLFLVIIVLIGVFLYKKYSPDRIQSPANLSEEDRLNIVNNLNTESSYSPEAQQQKVDQLNASSSSQFSEEERLQIIQSLPTN